MQDNNELSACHRGLAEGARDCVAVSSKAKVEDCKHGDR